MSMRFTGFKHSNAMDVVEARAGHRAGRLILVDVREHSERARGFAPGSRHLPLAQLKARMDELPADRPIAFICQSGRRSALATTAARRAGLNAHNVAGGMSTWERQGLEVEGEGRHA
jgi:rhodanese-related sulfurtransferase